MKAFKFLVLVSLALLVIPLTAQQQVKLEPFVEQWLFDNCDVGDIAPEKVLSTFGEKAEPLLLKALQQGPREEHYKELETALSKRWEKRQRVLSSSDFQALSEEELETAKKLTQKQYKEREKQKFVVRYKDRAIQGLGYVGTEKSVEVLEKISADKSPLKSSADAALSSIRNRIAKPNEQPMEDSGESTTDDSAGANTSEQTEQQAGDTSATAAQGDAQSEDNKTTDTEKSDKEQAQ